MPTRRNTADSADLVDPLERMGRRARKALAVRRALFEAGLNAFSRQPIALVSILDITEAADVAKGVFYLQFRSKDDYLLALWQNVQRQGLESIRSAVSARPAEGEARLTSIVTGLLGFATAAPAAARFWLRMSSYYADEVGLPGDLTRVREQYIFELAALVAEKNENEIDSADLQRATVVDALCWAAVAAAAQAEQSVLTDSAVVAAVGAALNAPAPGQAQRRTKVRGKSTRR